MKQFHSFCSWEEHEKKFFKKKKRMIEMTEINHNQLQVKQLKNLKCQQLRSAFKSWSEIIVFALGQVLHVLQSGKTKKNDLQK